MESSERERIVTGYLEYSEALLRRDSEDRPALDKADGAYSQLQQLIRQGPADLAWGLVIDVLRRAPDQHLDVYAAGPLEDLVRRWGAELVGVIEEEAARDERFRWALGCIWLLVIELPSTALARIVQASDRQIEPLDEHGILRYFDCAN